MPSGAGPAAATSLTPTGPNCSTGPATVVGENQSSRIANATKPRAKPMATEYAGHIAHLWPEGAAAAAGAALFFAEFRRGLNMKWTLTVH